MTLEFLTFASHRKSD